MKSQKNLYFLLCLIFLMPFSVPIKSQDRQSELKKGVTLSELLKAGDKHRYTVIMDANMFAYFNLFQNGVDAMITTYDSDGKNLILPFLRQLTYKVKLDFFSGQLAGKEI